MGTASSKKKDKSAPADTRQTEVSATKAPTVAAGDARGADGVPFSCSFHFHGAGDAGGISISESGELRTFKSSFCTMEHFHHQGCGGGERESTRSLPADELAKLQRRFATLDAFAAAAKPSDDSLSKYELTIRFTVNREGETRTITCRTPNYHALPTSLLPDSLGAFVEELFLLGARDSRGRDGSAETVVPAELVSGKKPVVSAPAGADDETTVLVVDNGGYMIKVRLDPACVSTFTGRMHQWPASDASRNLLDFQIFVCAGRLRRR